MELWEALLVGALSGSFSAIGTIAALKTDISWLKESLRVLADRVYKLEQEVR